MKISKIHKRFSERLEQPDALTDPEKYLGPNYQDVLNFWFYLDTLRVHEKTKIVNRYYALVFSVRLSVKNAARNAAEDVVGREFQYAAWWAARNATGMEVFGWATVELIGSHKLLEQNKILTFLPFTHPIHKNV